MPVNLTPTEDAWNEDLKPIGLRTPQHESFADWWDRHSFRFSKLESRVLEQWVHRHWDESYYCRIPLESLSSEVRRMTTEVILHELASVDLRNTPIEGPETEPPEPARTMNQTGSWDIPILICESDDGFVFQEKPYPNVRYWLIEGHLRLRYLQVLDAMGKAAPDHDVLVLRSLPE